MSARRCLIAVVCTALLAASFPQQGASQNFLPRERGRAVRMACVGDYDRFCPNVPPGRGRVIRCLRRHADLLSQPCFQALTAWGLTAVDAFKRCLPDVATLCPQVPPHSGPALTCLQQNADKLTKTCRDSLADQDLLNGPATPQRR